MITAEANGEKFTFPDGTTPEQMGQAIDEYFASQTKNNNPGMLDKGLGVLDAGLSIASNVALEPIAGLSGLTHLALTGDVSGANQTIDKVKGFAFEPKTEQGQKMLSGIGETLQPIGDAFNKTEAFLGDSTLDATGSPALAAAAATLPTAILEIAGLGITRKAKKAAMIKQIEEAKGQGILRPDGTVEPKLKKALDEVGISADDIAFLDKGDTDTIKDFSDVGAKPTTGELTGDFSQLKNEQIVAESGVDQAASELRNFKLEQSNAIKASVNDFIKEIGVPDVAASTIKEALESRKSLLKSKRASAYEALGEAAEATDLPLLTNNMLDGWPDGGRVRTISSLVRPQAKELQNLLIEFGIETKPELVSKFKSEITPLSIANQENFRVRLNDIEQSDQTRRISVLTQPIKSALDAEVELASNILEEAGNPNVAALAKDARISHAALKTEFDAKSMTNKLISNKTNSNIPIIEDSDVYNKLVSRSTSVEEVGRLVNSLRGVKEGRKAIGNLQSAILLDLLDSSFAANTRKIKDVEVFGPNAYRKRLDALMPKIEIIFANNKAALNKISTLDRVAKRLTPPSGAIPKGSASYLFDLMQQSGLVSAERAASIIPGADKVLAGLTQLNNLSKNQKTTRRALRARPKLKAKAKAFKKMYPGLAVVLGVSLLNSEEQ